MLNKLRVAEPEPKQTALTMYCHYSQGFVPSPFQQDMLSQITDLDRWRKTLDFWFGNSYRAQSIQKMIDYYEQLKPQYRPGFDTGSVSAFVPEPPCDICGREICFDLHRTERGI